MHPLRGHETEGLEQIWGWGLCSPRPQPITVTAESATVLNVWRHIKNPTSSIDAYLLEKQLCHFYRAMHFSAKCGLAIACRLSVCPSVTLVICDYIGPRMEILETNCTNN